MPEVKPQGDAKHGKRYIAIYTGSSGTWPSKLIARLTEAYPSASKSIERMWQLSDAEVDMRVRLRLLDSCNVELVRIARNEVRLYTSKVRIAEGYDSGGMVKDPVAMRRHEESQALISFYLDGLYILSERVTNLTKALHEESSGQLWKLVVSSVQEGERRPVWDNLLNEFGRASASAAKQRKAMKSSLHARGSRTHKRHFRVFLEHQEGEEWPIVCYASHNPYQSTNPVIRFSDRERETWSTAHLAFLNWWCGKVDAALPPLK